MIIKIVAGIIITLIIIYIVPFILYSLASVLFGLKVPENESPLKFLLGILVSKIGTSLIFVLIFYVAKDKFQADWLTYAIIWWAGSAIGELGDSIKPDYSLSEAFIGIVSEAVYFPLSAYLVGRII